MSPKSNTVHLISGAVIAAKKTHRQGTKGASRLRQGHQDSLRPANRSRKRGLMRLCIQSRFPLSTAGPAAKPSVFTTETRSTPSLHGEVWVPSKGMRVSVSAAAGKATLEGAGPPPLIAVAFGDGPAKRAKTRIPGPSGAPRWLSPCPPCLRGDRFLSPAGIATALVWGLNEPYWPQIVIATYPTPKGGLP